MQKIVVSILSVEIITVIWWSNLDTWWADNKLLLVNCLWDPVKHIINHRDILQDLLWYNYETFVALTNQKPENLCCVNLWTQTRHSTTSIKSKCPWPSVSSSCWREALFVSLLFTVYSPPHPNLSGLSGVMGLYQHIRTRIDSLTYLTIYL